MTVERASDCPAGAPLVLDRARPIDQNCGGGRQARAQLSALLRVGEEGKKDAILITPLKISLPDGATTVRIGYVTSPNASARSNGSSRRLRRLGKKHPFLFTQSEAIHARSWIPIQDSPGVRITYGAKIHVPGGLRAAMSRRTGSPVFVAKGVYAFEMPQPIPSYLIALAVGDLEFRSLGPRSGVFAEPSVVAAAARASSRIPNR